MDRKEKQDARQVHPGDPGKRPSADTEELAIRWLCYEEYPLWDLGESDPESSE